MIDVMASTLVPISGQYTALGYGSMATLRKAGSISTGGTGDYHLRWDRLDLINTARQLDRDNWLHQGMIGRSVDYCIGPTGFTLQARTGVDGVNKTIEREIWNDFADSPEVRGLFDFPALTELVFRELLNCGDTLFKKLGAAAGDDLSGKLQHIEAERICGDCTDATTGERCEQGIWQSPHGSIAGFNVAAVHDQSGYIDTSGGEADRLSALHAIFPRGRWARTSQSRGLPIMQATMPLARRLDDILTAEAVSWQNLARFAFGVDTGGAQAGALPILGNVNAKERTAPATQDVTKMVTDLGHAIAFQGHDVKAFSYNRPGANFEQSVKMFVRLYGIPLGIPLEILMLDFGDANYSSARAIMLQAFMNFRRNQRMLITQFCSPVYRWVIGRAIASGRLAWRPGIFEHTWDVPGWPWIDEDKEVRAWAGKIDRALATQTQALASLGKDRADWSAERKRELLDAARLAREVEEETSGRIPAAEIWRHFAALAPGKTESAMRVGEPDSTAPDAPSADSPDENGDEADDRTR